MAFSGFTLTIEGRSALNQAQTSQKMDIKSIVIGDGMPPANFSTLTQLVNQLYEITEIKVDTTNDETFITFDLPSVKVDYYCREIGVKVSTDSGDVLYMYGSYGEDAPYIVNTTGAEATERRLRIRLIISGVSSVEAVIPSTLYVDYKDFETEVERSTEKESQLENDITIEIERAKNAEENIANAVADEVTRATGEEKKVSDAVADEVARATEAEENISIAIATEATRATEEETKISNAVDEEVTRATDAESQIASNLSAEITRATEEETKISDAVADEVTRATETEASLQDGKLNKDGDGSNLTAAFSAASSRENIATGEKASTIFGKIAKFFTDLKAVAFTGAAADLTTDATHRFTTDNDKTKLDGIATGANNYTHPTTHPATMITTDATHRFATDAEKTAWNAIYQQSTAYTDKEIADLIGGAPETLDTLKEIADAMAESETVVDALEAAIGSKANQTELTSHTGNSTIHITSTERSTWNNKLEKTGDGSNLTAAFSAASSRSNIATGEKMSTILGKIAKFFADLKTVAFTGAASDLSTDSTHRFTTDANLTKLSGIATGANNYTHPTTSGNKHVPTGGSSGQILRWSADGTAAWGSDTNTWRGIQNNLTSTSTSDSLAAAQGKILNEKIATLNTDLIKVASVNAAVTTAAPTYPQDYIAPYVGSLSGIKTLVADELPSGADIKVMFTRRCFYSASYYLTGIANYVDEYDSIYVQGSKAGTWYVSLVVLYV